MGRCHPALARAAAPWTPVEAGVYRLNRVTDTDFAVDCSPDDAAELPTARIHYEEQPREFVLNTVTTTIQVHTRISDLFRSPMDQVKEQLTVLVEKLKEKQEDELINNGNYGLLNSVHESMRVKPRGAGPTPDDLDELIARVWKEPAFSWRTRAPSRRSVANARSAAFRRPR